VVGLFDKDRVGRAGETGEDVCAEVLLFSAQNENGIVKWRHTFTGQMKYL
jgi:hypothetical protein